MEVSLGFSQLEIDPSLKISRTITEIGIEFSLKNWVKRVKIDQAQFRFLYNFE